PPPGRTENSQNRTNCFPCRASPAIRNCATSNRRSCSRRSARTSISRAIWTTLCVRSPSASPRMKACVPATPSNCKEQAVGSLIIENVKKAYGPIEVLKGIDLDVTDGEFVVFVGPSGCGKSTLLRVIAGLEDSSSGRVVIDGDDVSSTPPAK